MLSRAEFQFKYHLLPDCHFYALLEATLGANALCCRRPPPTPQMSCQTLPRLLSLSSLSLLPPPPTLHCIAALQRRERRYSAIFLPTACKSDAEKQRRGGPSLTPMDASILCAARYETMKHGGVFYEGVVQALIIIKI